MPKFTYDKKQREVAKSEGLFLCAVDIYGTYAKADGVTFAGPSTKEEADVLFKAVKEVWAMRQKRIKTPTAGEVQRSPVTH
jgi:hypothetical protein